MAEDRPPVATVREARASDVPLLIEILGHGALVDGREDPADPDSYEAARRAIAATPGCALLVAEVGDEVVGMCQLIEFRHFQVRGGRCAEIESVHVHPRWRGQGIGGQLLEEAVARAVAAGCYRVQLTSNKARTDAHRFYGRHDFVATHEGYKRLL
jgi:GNAT superfamily N-acetyltransferase